MALDRSILLVLVVTLMLVVAPRPAHAAHFLDSEEEAFLALINEYRATNGLPALKLSPTLTTASNWLSSDMGAKNYFSHTDSLGRSMSVRLAAFGYTYNYRAENIAAGRATASGVFSQWVNSYGHRQNMLNANYRAIGIGRVYTFGSRYGWYWTTNFGGTADTATSAALSGYTGTSGSYYLYPPEPQVTVSGTVVGNYSGMSVSVPVYKYVYDSVQGKYIWTLSMTLKTTLSSAGSASTYSTHLTLEEGKYARRVRFAGSDYIRASNSVWRYFRVVPPTN